MKAKSGKKIEAVKPQDPEEVFEADDASPGKIAEIKSTQKTKQSGKYGETKLPPHKPAKTDSGSSGASESGVTSSGTGAAAEKSSTAEKSVAEKKDEKKTSWIGIKLVGEDGNGVVGENYEVELPDGTLAKGSLGADGTAKVEGFEPGKCIVRFPKLVKGSVSKK